MQECRENFQYGRHHLVIIGAGPSGFADGQTGNTGAGGYCLNCICVPIKIDLPAIFQYKQKVSARLSSCIESPFKGSDGNKKRIPLQLCIYYLHNLQRNIFFKQKNRRLREFVKKLLTFSDGYRIFYIDICTVN